MNLIATASTDKKLKVWDPQSETCVLEIECKYYFPNSIIFSPDCSKLLCLYNSVMVLWDLNTGELLHEFPHQTIIKSATFNKEGDIIISCLLNANIKVWDVYTHELLNTITFDTQIVSDCCINSEGDKIAISDDNTIRIYNIETGVCLSELPREINPIRLIKFSPDGSKIASTTIQNVLTIYDVETHECLLTLENAVKYKNFSQFSGDGNRLITHVSSNHINVWDVYTGECIKSFINNDSNTFTSAINFDGSIMAIVSTKGEFNVWDVYLGECIHSLMPDPYICTMAFSPCPTGSYI